MKNVYCIGEILIDFVAERQGKDLIQACEFAKKAGGAPANVAAAIAKLGGISHFVGCIGNDPFGDFLIQTMKNLNVSVNHSQRSNTFTTLAFVSLAEDGERDFVFNRGADKELTHLKKLSSFFNDEILHLGSATALLGGRLEKTYTTYLKDAFINNAFISFDPNFRADLWKNDKHTFVKKCLPFIEKADFAKFSLEEAKLISGNDDVKAACKKLHGIGANIIAVTLGSAGTFLSTKSHQETIGSVSIKSIDTTGAGDAFVGCLLKQFSELENPKQELQDFKTLKGFVCKANIAGAMTTTKYGAIAALPTQGQLDQFN